MSCSSERRQGQIEKQSDGAPNHSGGEDIERGQFRKQPPENRKESPKDRA